MKKAVLISLTLVMLILSTVPVFAEYRRSMNVSSESEQWPKAAEEWLKSNGSWITGDDIYFIRYGGRDIEHAVEVDVEKKTIKTARGKVYDLNYDGFLRDFSGTKFRKKTGNSEKPWEDLEWPQIVMTKEKKEGSDENGKYFYYEFKYEFVKGY